MQAITTIREVRGEGDQGNEAALLMAGDRIEAIGGGILRYGLVAILLYFGAFKFTATEAAAIQPLVAHSPLMAWLYNVLSVQAVSNLIGATELLAAILLAVRPWAPRASAVGGALGAATFLVTLSFLFTSPGAWDRAPDFPLPVPGPAGAFLIKDVFLLGAAVWSAGEALRAAARRSPPPSHSPLTLG